MKVGLDISSIGYFVLMNGSRIVDICKVPQKQDIYKLKIISLEHEIKQLEPQLKIKGMKGKTQDKINVLKRQILTLQDNSPRDISRVKDWLLKYKDNIEIVNIEKPLLQAGMFTQINSIVKAWEYLGICTCILDSVGIKYNIVSIDEWRSNFDYTKPPKDCKNKRQFTKSESIRIAEEVVENIKDWYVLKGCRKINDDICESCLLSMI